MRNLEVLNDDVSTSSRDKAEVTRPRRGRGNKLELRRGIKTSRRGSKFSASRRGFCLETHITGKLLKLSQNFAIIYLWKRNPKSTWKKKFGISIWWKSDNSSQYITSLWVGIWTNGIQIGSMSLKQLRKIDGYWSELRTTVWCLYKLKLIL